MAWDGSLAQPTFWITHSDFYGVGVWMLPLLSTGGVVRTNEHRDQTV
jgi:hypothetical protein